MMAHFSEVLLFADDSSILINNILWALEELAICV